MMNIDLHTYSSCSGGSDSPAGLIRKACSAGLSAVALTDFCSLDGLSEAAAEAQAQDMELIPGIELPCRMLRYDKELRVLGYYFDPDNAALRSLAERAVNEIPTIGQATALIREAGGLVALADPRSCGAEGMSLDWFMQNVRCCGVEFIEVIYPGYSPEESQFWLDTAKEWGMDPVGGSGYGLNGISRLGELQVDYEVLAWLKECKANL